MYEALRYQCIRPSATTFVKASSLDERMDKTMKSLAAAISFLKTIYKKKKKKPF